VMTTDNQKIKNKSLPEAKLNQVKET